MKTGLILSCLAMAGLTGCMSTHELWGEAPAEATSALAKFQGKEVDITLTNGVFHEDVIFSFFGDSVSFRSTKAGASTSIPLTSVAAVSKSGSALGPILCCLGGLIVGGSIGSSMALEDHTSAKQTNFADRIGMAITAPMAAGAGAVVGGVLGGATGLIIGSLLGSGDRYILDPGPDTGISNGKGERCFAVGVTASGDSILLGVAGLIDRSPEKVTVYWRGKKLGIARPPAEVVKKGRNIQIIAPENAWQ